MLTQGGQANCKNIVAQYEQSKPESGIRWKVCAINAIRHRSRTLLSSGAQEKKGWVRQKLHGWVPSGRVPVLWYAVLRWNGLEWIGM